ncbi:MAG: hybrid sensor histidine kinase/response regulator [Fibrobacteres bacterium]|nr:hybrid sensor histidine kinase/response regulator [Fibrobacterota bacterium]
MDGDSLGMNGKPMDDTAEKEGPLPELDSPAAPIAKEEKVKVLLVDDLPHKLTALSSIIENDSLTLVTATSGFDALRHLLRDDFAVILLDVQMPGLDGFETAALIRQRKRSEHTPIIFITANLPNDGNLSKGYQLGAVDYIYAPVVPEILKAKVAVFVELFRINRKVRQQTRALRTYTLDLELVNRQLEHRTRELQSSKESFRNIVEKNQEGIAVVDAGGTIRFANPAFVHMLGDPSGGAMGRPFPFPMEVGVIQEIDHLGLDDKTLPIEVSLAETQWEGGTAYLASVRDISQRRGAENALKDSEEKLRQAQKLESIGRLAGGVAHDFNNLLTAINGYTDMVLASMEDENPLKGYLHEVRRSGERAAELTHQLLAYSRKQVLVPKLLNLNIVVDNMTNMLRRLIGDNIELLAVPDTNLGLVKADPGQLEQVIMNLVVNAKDAMPDGGRISVETGMEVLDIDSLALHPIDKEISINPGTYVVLTVSDTGTGMDEETRGRIFEPFFTTKEVGRGTGLGLSMVYGFVKQSGGNITVASIPNQGTTFRIYLPMAIGSTAWKPNDGERNPKGAEGFENILLVEDETTVRKFLLSVLQHVGYNVIEASDGKQAMEIAEAREGTIHLLLTDVMMANMGGRELASKLSECRPEMKVLFMSGYTEDCYPKGWEARNGVEFLQKPFSPGVLAQKVRAVLDSARAVA